MEDEAVELATKTQDGNAAQVLSVQCPECGLSEDDDYEIVSSDVPTTWRCSGCKNCFEVVAIDCESCWSASYAQILTRTALAWPQAMTCRHCGGALFTHLFTDDGAELDEQWH